MVWFCPIYMQLEVKEMSDFPSIESIYTHKTPNIDQSSFSIYSSILKSKIANPNVIPAFP